MNLEEQIKQTQEDLERAEENVKQKKDELFILLLEAKKRGIKPLDS
tara:strand:+ start:1171 stop:1308 length:138 start_codon:yes stop_codon:yes gene_type:complete